VPPCETQSTPSPPQALDCLVPICNALPVSQTKGHAEQHAHEGLTATVVWLRSVQWLDSVGLVGVGFVAVGLVGVGLVGIDTRKSACGSGLEGVGL